MLVGGALAYNRLGGSREVKRDRALKKAQEYLSQAKVSEAIIEYKNALQADPGSPEAHYEFGLALLKQQEFRTAYNEFVRAADLKPDFIPARFQLASMHAASKDTERAKQELEKIRQVDRDAKETHLLAAQIALAEKQPDKAIEELEAALNKEPDKAAIYIDMGRVHASKKDFAAAEAAFAKRWKWIPSSIARA